MIPKTRWLFFTRRRGEVRGWWGEALVYARQKSWTRGGAEGERVDGLHAQVGLRVSEA
jgi:hypothetical protein